MKELDSIKISTNSKFYKDVVNKANVYCESRPVVVTDKQKTFAPDNHYYCSMSSYWWPDPQNPGHYINRDGYVNPERNEYDRDRLSTLADRCVYLSKAFYFTGKDKYYYSFIEQIRAWFLYEDTYMYPNFEYTQVVPGLYENKGRSSGMIDAYSFNAVIESIRLVNGIKKIDKRTIEGVQKWFCEFACDTEERWGSVFNEPGNNIYIAYDVTLINMYLFSGEEKKARTIIEKFPSKRIEAQVLEDGSQPAELKRTKAFSYSLFNLTHILDFCYLAKSCDEDYYAKQGERIDKAFSFLEQYVDDETIFPYQQITSWDDCRKTLMIQKMRVNKLKQK